MNDDSKKPDSESLKGEELEKLASLVQPDDSVEALASKKRLGRADLSSLSRQSHLRPARRKVDKPESPASVVSVKEVIDLISVVKGEAPSSGPEVGAGKGVFREVSEPAPKSPPPEVKLAGKRTGGIKDEIPDETPAIREPSSIPPIKVEPLHAAEPHQASAKEALWDKEFESDRASTGEVSKEATVGAWRAWLVAFAVLALSGMGFGVYHFVNRAPVVPSHSTAVVSVIEASVEAPVELAAEAEAVARAFLASETPSELLRHVHEPRLTRTQLKGRYEQLTFEKIGEPQRMSIFATGKKGNASFCIFSFRLKGGGFEDFLYLSDEGAGFKVDWQAFLGHSEMAWADFLKDRPQTPILIRCLCRRDFFYSKGYDEKNWQCYRLSNPNEEEVLFAYTERDSDMERKLAAMIPSLTQSDQQGREFLATFRVNFSERGKGRQLAIVEVVGSSWFE